MRKRSKFWYKDDIFRQTSQNVEKKVQIMREKSTFWVKKPKLWDKGKYFDLTFSDKKKLKLLDIWSKLGLNSQTLRRNVKVMRYKIQ